MIQILLLLSVGSGAFLWSLRAVFSLDLLLRLAILALSIVCSVALLLIFVLALVTLLALGTLGRLRLLSRLFRLLHLLFFLLGLGRLGLRLCCGCRLLLWLLVSVLLAHI